MYKWYYSSTYSGDSVSGVLVEWCPVAAVSTRRLYPTCHSGQVDYDDTHEVDLECGIKHRAHPGCGALPWRPLPDQALTLNCLPIGLIADSQSAHRGLCPSIYPPFTTILLHTADIIRPDIPQSWVVGEHCHLSPSYYMVALPIQKWFPIFSFPVAASLISKNCTECTEVVPDTDCYI